MDTDPKQPGYEHSRPDDRPMTTATRPFGAAKWLPAPIGLIDDRGAVARAVLQSGGLP
jgi:hypothetical protein